MNGMQHRICSSLSYTKIYLQTFHHNSELNEEHPVDYILSECETLFQQIHIKFAPCWFPLRSKYREILSMEASTQTWLNGVYDTRKGIFWVVIEMLEDLLPKDSPKNFLDDESDSDGELMYVEWELKQAQIKRHQESISRDDKIKRGFLILKMLAGLLEHDLCMFIKKYVFFFGILRSDIVISDLYSRHNKNVEIKMREKHQMPIIASLFWDSDVGHINENMKRLIQLYVNCLSLNFPKNEIETLSVSSDDVENHSISLLLI